MANPTLPPPPAENEDPWWPTRSAFDAAVKLAVETQLAALDSPTFTGTPAAPTPTAGDNDTSIATTAFVTAAVTAGGATDATTTTKGIVKLAGDLGGTADLPTVPGLTGKAPLASPVFTGNPTAPTPATADNDTSIATTAFVKAQGYATLASPALTGTPTAPTPTAGDNDTSIATTAFVTNRMDIVGMEVRRNFAVDPRGTANTAWTGLTGIIGLDAGPAFAGSTMSRRFTRLATGVGRAATIIGTSFIADTVFSARMSVQASEELTSVVVNYRPDANTSTGQSPIVSLTIPAGVSEIIVTGITASGAATANAGIALLYSTGTVGSTLDITNVLVEKSYVLGTYFDGGSAVVDDLTPSWVGAVDASASVLRSPAVVHGTTLRATRGLYVGVNAQTGTTYTPVLADQGKLVTCTNAAAITVTMPSNTTTAFPIGTQIDFAVLGAGMVTFVAGAGATVDGTPSLVTRAQYSAVTLIKISTNGWLAVGDLA